MPCSHLDRLCALSLSPGREQDRFQPVQSEGCLPQACVFTQVSGWRVRIWVGFLLRRAERTPAPLASHFHLCAKNPVVRCQEELKMMLRIFKTSPGPEEQVLFIQDDLHSHHASCAPKNSIGSPSSPSQACPGLGGIAAGVH